jgi:hypothetical protein
MKQEIEINERIESYLNGDLPAGEAAKFLELLAKDPVLAKEVELHRRMREFITDGAYLQVKNELRSIHMRKIRTSRRIRRITGSGLGGLILGIVAYILLTGNPKTEPGIDRSTPMVSLQRDSGKIEVAEGPYPVSIPDAASETVSTTSLYALQEAQPVMPDTTRISGKEIISSDPVTPAKDMTPREKAVSEITADVPTLAAATGDPGADCRKIEITAGFTETESCNNKPTGRIMINGNSVSGGLPPYTFSVDRNNFRDTLQFSGLYPGNYTLYARDANNCVNRLGTAVIRAVDCSYQAAFYPYRGETWTVPVEPERQGTLSIFSKTGVLVYSVKVYGDQVTTWNGSTVSGQQLPMGLYPFEIVYSDGTGFIGTVTILR